MTRARKIFKLLPATAVLGTLLLAQAAAPAAASEPAQPAPPACTTDWSYKVSHSWWTEKGHAFPGRHIHLGACVPSHVRISSSSIPLQADVTLHGDPGLVNWVRACWNSSCPDSARITVNRRCSSTCTFSVPITLPTGGRNGWYELRLTANIGHNVFDDRQFQSTRYAVGLGNAGTQPTSGEGGRTGMAGWYHDHYQNVTLDEASAKRLEAGPITLPFTFKLRGDRASTIVAVDANSHASDPGLVLRAADGSVGTGFETYTIPAGSLEPGWHSLFGRTEEPFADGVSAGQGEFPFRVSG